MALGLHRTALEAAKDLALVGLSFVALPFSTAAVIFSLIYTAIWVPKCVQRRTAIREGRSFRPRQILVTGVGMTKGLVLARAFYCEGHDVVGADFESGGALASGRVSKSLRQFYSLPEPDSVGLEGYIRTLKDIILRERIELWVSCSGVVTAVEDGLVKEAIERETECACIQFDAETTKKLHEKDSFMKHIAGLNLQIPDTHTVFKAEDATKALSSASPDKNYILKPIGVDDARRADMTLLPLKTPDETAQHVSKLSINEKQPYILQQFISGREYCTHSLVVHGQVLLFVACPSSDLLMHYTALPPGSYLAIKMLEFTKKIAEHGGSQFTGHLSFDFLIDDMDQTSLHPIECNPRCHTADVLFEQDTEALTRAYLAAADGHSSLVTDSRPFTPSSPHGYYWIGHDLVALLILPVFNAILLKTSPSQAFDSILLFIVHLLCWKDGTFQTFDPLPWWWLYHVYWPARLLQCLRHSQKWSRLNVSTTKMFGC